MTTIDALRNGNSALAAVGAASGVNGGAWAAAMSATETDDDTTTASARTDVIGGSLAAPSSALAAQESETEESAVEQFLAYVHMDPIERMRAQILGSMDLTEEQLAALPEDERKRIEDKIRQIIEETVRRDAAEQSASAEQPVDETQQSAAAAATTKTADGSKTASTAEEPSALEILLPFLRPDGGPQLGGTDADATAERHDRNEDARA